jgi:phenylpropionate dioxygenase-like ring-hydroxylating dioxygenase large terminal subunit
MNTTDADVRRLSAASVEATPETSARVLENVFLKNTWYVLGWSEEFRTSGPHGRLIAGEPIVLYRGADGILAALEDRCPHRWAPLSKGRVEGEAIRCMYHGIKFGRDGRCLEIPGQTTVSKALQVRSYPVVEKYSLVWVWPGSVERADPNTIPDLSMLVEADRRIRHGSLEYEAHATLICDNLLDLSHIAYLHEKTFGRPPDAPSASRPRPMFQGGSPSEALDNGVRVEGWMDSATHRNIAVPAKVPDGDLWARTDFLIPGIYSSHLQMFPAGSAESQRWKVPSSELTPLSDSMSIQAVTPLTERTSRYFFSLGARMCDMDDEELNRVWGVTRATFSEDVNMIQAQQQMIDRYPGRRMAGIGADRGLVLFRRLMQKLIAAETGT